jgi:recombinational DNA repair ATPase RecF
MKKLDISNYRSCTKTGFDIHPNLTTLIGRNGAGKSNILNSIQLLKKVNYNKLLHKASLLDPSFLHSQIEMILDINNEEKILTFNI